MTQSPTNYYDTFSSEYADMVARREEAGIERDPIMPRFLEVLGSVARLHVLDAGCGEGYLARILARRGAIVTGVDIAANLVQLGREKDSAGQITYQVADLSQPQPALEQQFDLIVSNLVMNDVADYQGFLGTLATAVKPGGRMIFSMNNPYSFVVRSHITDYFDTAGVHSYRGMAAQGVKVHFYHRTLEQYLAACLTAGFQLQRLVDIPTPEGTFTRRADTLIPVGYAFPFFMVLSLIKGTVEAGESRQNAL
jgi:2-polyprenyl-3-methyl-5-hydroxy-6-metoxy-1,4-benzoquinol methylase